jgi:PAS domain-containing protein
MRVIINNPERTVFMGSVDNITEEKSAQDALKRNQETYQYAMDMTGDIIFEYDIETKKIINSINFQKRFGRIPFIESWIKSIVSYGVVKYEHIEEFVNVFDKIINGEQHSVKCKLELRDTNNEYQWYSIYTRGIYDTENNLIKLIGIITDIDSLKSRLME